MNFESLRNWPALLCLAALPAWPQVGVGPHAAPATPAIQAPVDRPFHGAIQLAVDARDTTRHVVAIHETIPVQDSRTMVLLYPQWETGSHAATASAAALAGLQVHAGGRPLDWHRDPVNVFAFHVDVPKGAATIDIDFQFLSPVSARAGAVTMTKNMLNVPWTSVFLYPAGWFARDIPVAATLALPDGWQAATALRASTARTASPPTMRFETATLERLADSPVYAGRFVRRVALGDVGGAPVNLTLLAESPEDLIADDARFDDLRALLQQSRQLFGARHFAHYDFLVALGDAFPGPGGVEHLDSSEIVLPADYLANAAAELPNADLLAHEFVHSWNGRFRQPADLWTAAFNEPMRDSLLWVYEGQTQFWGRVLAARTGQRTLQQALDQWALDAAESRGVAGRSWKSLQESSSDSLIMAGHAVTWRDWTRREDYYFEGPLLWLDVDARLRELTHEQRGLDDFARAFFGGRDGDEVTRTYTFDDLCAGLDGVAHADWAAFLRQHLATRNPDDVLRGLDRAGWRLAWDDKPSPVYVQAEADAGGMDLSWSIGAIVTAKGALRSVRWDGSVFRAGLIPGDRIVSVNGRPFDAEVLKAAIGASTDKPIELSVDGPSGPRQLRLEYRGSLRYPHLQRVPGTVDRLSALLAPRSPASAAQVDASGFHAAR